MTAKVPSLFDKCVLWWPGEHVTMSNAAKAITANGDVKQILRPFNNAGIAMFDGNGDYLTIPDSEDFNFGSNLWSIEFWFYPLSTTYAYLISKRSSNNVPSFVIAYNSTGIYVGVSSTGASLTPVANYGGTVTLNAWHRVQVFRDSGYISFYLNGVLIDRTTAISLYSNTYPVNIGYNTAEGDYFNGYISELRILNGSNPVITPQTTPFTVDANTKLLLHFTGNGNTFTDETGKTVTAYGDAKQLPLDPWGLARPVGYFNRSASSYLGTPYTNDFNFGSGGWTIGFWIYHLPTAWQTIVSFIDPTARDTWMIDFTSTNEIQITSYDYSASQFIVNMSTSGANLPSNQWVYIEVVKESGGYYKVFVGGNSQTLTGNTTTDFITLTAGYLRIGYGESTSGDYVDGYLCDVHISKGIARHSSNFTPPTTRFKPDQYTKLLLHMYGSGATFTDDPFVDVNEFPIIPSGVTVTPNGTFYKDDLGNNKQVVKFDGSTNYLSLSDNDAWAFYNSNFTISAWLYPINSTNAMYFFIQYGSSTLYMAIGYNPSSNRIVLYWNLTASTAISYYSSQTLSFDTWYHIVMQRSGSTTNMYLNGIPITVVPEYTWVTIPNISAPLIIGKNASTAYSKCAMKDLMLFTRALSLAEIRELMTLTHPITGEGILPGLYDYWRLS